MGVAGPPIGESSADRRDAAAVAVNDKGLISPWSGGSFLAHATAETPVAPGIANIVDELIVATAAAIAAS
jgi:hypothetical protein